MTDEENSKCHKIIHTAAVAAGGVGAGLAQLPGSDTVPITAIQVGMIISLGSVFGIEITKAAATTILAGAAASVGGRTISQFLVGWIPGIGNAINAGTAATITEGIGWYVAKNFSEDAEKKRKEERARREAKERARREAEEKARREAEEKARREAEERARREAEEKARREAEEKARQEAEEKARREAEENKSMILPLIINSVIVVSVCCFFDSVLDNSGLNYKKWGIISGILITIISNFLVAKIFKFRKLENKSAKFISYSNFLTAAFNIALSIIVTMGADYALSTIGEKFSELQLNFGAIVTVIKVMYYMPVLNFGLLIMALYSLIKYDKVLRAIGRFIIGLLHKIERIAKKIFKVE